MKDNAVGNVDDQDRQVKCLWLVVLFSACLGGIIHGFKSLAKHVREGTYKAECAIHYYSMPLVSAMLGLGSYFLIRGGVLTLNATPSSGTPYASSGIALLIGMFSDQAIAKLKDIAETIFKPKAAGENPLPSGNGNGNGQQPPPPQGGTPPPPK